ncbi:MAG: TrkH family potassium uptake protein [Bacillota bacterium]
MDSGTQPGLRRLRPAQILVVSFLAIIGLGTLLLLLPWATAPGRQTSLVEALFTATSAVCVTGLVVVDTSTHWSRFGQVVIMMLIQAGGLGIMTTGTIFALLTGRRIGLRERLVIRESFGKDGFSGIVRLLQAIVLTTFLLEGLGAIYLANRFAQDMPTWQAWYYGVFHSVSAFCNAGFDLFGDSLVRYVSDPAVNFGFMTLIILGGLGFPVLVDVYRRVRRYDTRLSLHARLVLVSTAVLLAAGTLAVLVFEHANPATLGSLGMRGRILSSLFHSVTPRTAGFNTLPTGQLLPITLLVTMALMFVGASPGGTGGGIKTTTFVTLLMGVKTPIAGRQEIEVFQKRIGKEILEKSLAIAFLGMALVTFTTGFLLVSEGFEFLPVLFESISAFGTVGLSMGITPGLTSAGRLMIIVTMFAGRVGPLTVFMAIATRNRALAAYRRPEEKIMVG